MTRPERWTGAGAILLAGFIVAGWLATLGEASGGPQRAVPLAALATSVLFSSLALAGVVALASPQPYGRLGLGSGRLPAWSVLALVAGTLALSFAVDAALRNLDLRETGALAEFDRSVEQVRGRGLVLAVVGLGLAPAIGEELLFRGLVQRGLARRVGPPLAILGASALFAIVHADPTHTPASFLLGVYLGVIAELTASIRASMLCHAVNNLAAVATGAAGLTGLPISPAWILIALGVAVAAPWVAWRCRRPSMA